MAIHFQGGTLRGSNAVNDEGRTFDDIGDDHFISIGVHDFSDSSTDAIGRSGDTRSSENPCRANLPRYSDISRTREYLPCDDGDERHAV